MKKIIFIFLFLIFIVLTRIYLLAIYTVNQNSMDETYKDGDRVLIIKNLYTIQHNDILVFAHENENLIKRCIGLPGDSIKIINNKIFVNHILTENPSRAKIMAWTNKDIFLQSLIFQSYGADWNPNNFGDYLIPKKGTKIILNDRNIALYENLIKEDSNSFELQHKGFYIFKNDYYYLIGDNRSMSVDSRFFGPIKSEDIVGKVILPFNK